MITVHNGQKDCDTCGKLFSRAGTLKIHIKTVHNGQKDHKCDSCEKAFSSAQSLKKHIIDKETSNVTLVKSHFPMQEN